MMTLMTYMMALIKQEEWFYLFDPHARNCLGMPDPNGTAVVMQFANILDLEQYLYALSEALHSNLFEIVPVQFMEFVNKRTYSSQTMNVDKSVRLVKNREAKKRKRSEETDRERQLRLQSVRECMNKKRSEETDCNRQYRLQSMREFVNKKRKGTQNQTNKRTKRVSLPQSEKNQNNYLSAFDISENGGIEEQSWAKTNMNKFHKSIQYVVSQCTVCFEA